MNLSQNEDKPTIDPMNDVVECRQSLNKIKIFPQHIEENISTAVETIILEETQMEIDFVDLVNDSE